MKYVEDAHGKEVRNKTWRGGIRDAGVAPDAGPLPFGCPCSRRIVPELAALGRRPYLRSWMASLVVSRCSAVNSRYNTRKGILKTPWTLLNPWISPSGPLG
jgi:hypothetical protein